MSFITTNPVKPQNSKEIGTMAHQPGLYLNTHSRKTNGVLVWARYANLIFLSTTKKVEVMPTYSGLCISGPKAGMMVTHNDCRFLMNVIPNLDEATPRTRDADIVEPGFKMFTYRLIHVDASFNEIHSQYVDRTTGGKLMYNFWVPEGSGAEIIWEELTKGYIAFHCLEKQL